MGWVFWAVLSAVFAAGTALLLAKVGVEHIDSNPGDGDMDDGDPGVYVGDCGGSRSAWRTADD